MKYEALKRHLERQFDLDRTFMSFAEIEGVLTFRLPVSARKYQAWWSNARQGHSHAAAWLDAGWRTADLDLVGETVCFVKDQAFSLAEDGGAFRHRDAESMILRLEDLSSMARRLIEDHASRHGVDLTRAVTDILDETAIQRRKATLDWFAKALPPTGLDSVDLIREDRDGR
jgi:hypothetical protein